MKCPKCDAINSPASIACHQCGQYLHTSSDRQEDVEVKTSRNAIDSLVCGILTFFTCGLAGIVGIIYGIVALHKISKSNGQLKGKRLAIAGITLSILFAPIGLFILYIALNMPHSDVFKSRQRAMYHSIGVALDLFNAEFEDYPPSDDNSLRDPNAQNNTEKAYCGALKLAEAMVGQDLLGFHSDSKFRQDGWDRDPADPHAKQLYTAATELDRKGALLPLDNANAFQLKDIYKDTGPFDPNSYVLCDVYIKTRHSGKHTGMPILYYKANSTNTSQDHTKGPSGNEIADDIYSYRDNENLLKLGVPGKKNIKHPLAAGTEKQNWKSFEEMILNRNKPGEKIPYRSDSYLLFSAGYDGLYGTRDDIFNFVK